MIKKEGDKSIYNKKRNIRVLEMDEARSRSCASSLAAANLLVGEVPTERSEEQMSEQLTLDLGDPFMGSK